MKKENGITLIALVITIIVMLILVGVSVTVALNGGLFTTAKQAKENTATERDKELNLSDGKVEINGEWYNSIDEYVNGGSANNPEDENPTNPSEPTEPENPTGYTAYTIGQEVTVAGENFYVIADSDATQEKVTLLAKDCIDTTSLVQSASAGTVAFSTESYWGSGTSPYDIEETTPIPDSHKAAKAAYDYGAKVGGTGRLMTHSEATALQTANSDILYGRNGKSSSTYLRYWLGSAVDEGHVWFVYGSLSTLGTSDFGIDFYYGVRPVVEISKSSIS